MHLLPIFSSPTGMEQSAAHNFFVIPELLASVVELCSWPSLASLSNVDRQTRGIVREYIRRRVRFFISKFIPSGNIVQFFKVLRMSGGAIAGGVVRCVMSVHLPHLYQMPPSQLDILLSSWADHKSMADFIQSQGYTYTKSGFCSRTFAVGCKYNELYTSVRQFPVVRL